MFGRLICWMLVGMFVGCSFGWAVLWWFGFAVWLILLFASRDCGSWEGEVRLSRNSVQLFFVFLSALLFGFQTGVMLCCFWVFWLGRVVF